MQCTFGTTIEKRCLDVKAMYNYTPLVIYYVCISYSKLFCISRAPTKIKTAKFVWHNSIPAWPQNCLPVSRLEV